MNINENTIYHLKDKIKEEFADMLANLKEQQNHLKQIETLMVRAQRYKQALTLRKWKHKFEDLIKEFEDSFN